MNTLKDGSAQHGIMDSLATSKATITSRRGTHLLLTKPPPPGCIKFSTGKFHILSIRVCQMTSRTVSGVLDNHAISSGSEQGFGDVDVHNVF